MAHLGETPDDAAAAGRPPPTVSIIVPAYNAAWSIGRTLASLQAQTWADFECVIVDDGSTDATAACVDACIAGDARFTLIRQDNAGVAAARNRGLRAARGRYVANLDADDLWRPSFLSRLVDGLERAGPGAAIGFARSLWIGPDDAVLGAAPEPLKQVGYRDILLRNPIGNGSATLMRRDAVVACGGWDAELVRDYGPGEDWLLQLQLAARGPVMVVDEPLVLYRISLASASWDLERSARAAAEVIRRRQGCAPRLPPSDYWTARSLAMLWLLRRARQGGQLRLAVWMAVQIYLLNPAWLGEPGLREPFVTAPGKGARRLRGWIRSRMAPEAGASLQEVGLDQVGDGAAPPA